MYKVRSTKTYRKAYARVSKHKNFNPRVLEEVIEMLARGERLDAKYQDHQLSGELQEYRECHIQHNLLLEYQKHDNILVLLLINIGTHDDIFH